LGIFSAAIAGIVAAKGLQLNKFTCATVRFLDDITNGDKSLKWIGIVGAANTLSSLAGQVGGVVSTLGSFSMDSAQGARINANYTICTNRIDSIYNTYNTMTVPRADPTVTPNSYTPDFIANLGPKEASGKITNTLYVEMKTKNDLI